MTNRIATFVGFGMLIFLFLITPHAVRAEEPKANSVQEVQMFTPEYQRQREVATDDQSAAAVSGANGSGTNGSGITPADPNQMRRVEELTQRADHIR